MRNIEKTINYAKENMNSRHDLSIEEIEEIKSRVKSGNADAIIDLIYDSFLFGYGVAKKEVLPNDR